MKMSIQQKAKMMTFKKLFSKLKTRKNDEGIYQILDEMVTVLQTYSEKEDPAINSLIERIESCKKCVSIDERTGRLFEEYAEKLEFVIAEIDLYLEEYFI